MVNAPSLNPSTGSSLIELFAVVLLVAGIAIALSAIPAFRSRAAQHAAQIRTIVDPGSTAPAPTNTAQQGAPASTAAGTSTDSTRRREIDEFDISLFDR